MTTRQAEIVELDDDGPEMEDVTDFIAENNITMDVLLIHENPCRPKQNQRGAVHWSCKITMDKRFIIVYFSKGENIRRWIAPPQTGLGQSAIPLHVPHDKIDERYDGPLPPFENDEDRRLYHLCSQPEPPYLIEVLDILAKDIWLLEQTGSFENWARVLGLHADSRAARGAFEVICQQRVEMIALLGDDAFHKLLYEIDRINPWKFKEETEDEPEIVSTAT